MYTQNGTFFVFLLVPFCVCMLSACLLCNLGGSCCGRPFVFVLGPSRARLALHARCASLRVPVRPF